VGRCRHVGSGGGKIFALVLVLLMLAIASLAIDAYCRAGSPGTR
jgi:hypothetical protein